MKTNKYEIRTVDSQLLLREGGEEGNSRIVRGYAIVFDKESVVLDEYGDKYREVISPECVTNAWLMTQDVKMNMLHDRTLTIARCNKGKGNMQLGVDDKGVWFEFEAPKCDIGDRCVAMVREEVFTGCSFEFLPKKWDVEPMEGDYPLVRHREFALLGALTVGMDPAYMQTSVSLREMCSAQEEPAPVEEVAAPSVEEPAETDTAAPANRERENISRRVAAIQREMEMMEDFEV